MKKILFLIVSMIFPLSAHAYSEYPLRAQLTGTSITLPAINAYYKVHECRVTFTPQITTGADIASISIESARGPTYDSLLSTADADGDGTPNIGATTRYWNVIPVQPWHLSKGDALVLEFTNTDSVTAEIECWHSF